MSNNIQKFKELYEENIEKICPSYNKTFYLSYTIAIILIILILTSLINIERTNCECANIPEKRFLKEWFIITLIIFVILMLLFISSKETCYLKFIGNSYFYIFFMIIGLINYVMLFRLLLFLRKMRKQCECGYGNLEKFLFWYLVIIFSIIGLMILLGIILMISTIIKMSK